jgi:hypothetical protein
VQTGRLQLPLDTSDFPELRLIRVRALQLIAVRAADGSFFSGSVRFPAAASIVLSATDVRPINQQGVPRIAIGDIGVPQPPDRRGYIASRSIQDTSPIGTWELRMSLSSSDGKPLAELEDLLLFITFAACDAG